MKLDPEEVAKRVYCRDCRLWIMAAPKCHAVDWIDYDCPESPKYFMVTREIANKDNSCEYFGAKSELRVIWEPEVKRKWWRRWWRDKS